MGPIQSWPSIRRPASSASRCSRTGSASARCARGRGPGSARWRRSRWSSPPTARTRSTGSPTDVNAQQALGELLAADPLAARPPGRGDRRPRHDRRPHRQGLHRPRRPRHRRAPQLPGQHDGPRHRPAGDVGRVRGAHRRAPGPPAGRARRGRGRRRRRARAPVGGDGRRARPTASRGGGRSTCASRTTTRRSTSCAGCSTLQRAYDLAGAGDELLAAGRTDEAGELYRRAAELAPSSDELLFWSGLARAQAGDLEGGVAAVRRAAEENPNWLVLLDRLSPEFAPAGEAVRQQIT